MTNTEMINRSYRLGSDADRYVQGRSAVVLEDCYYGQPIPAGSLVTISRLSNAGFRGIEASVTLADGSRAVLSLGNLEVR